LLKKVNPAQGKGGLGIHTDTVLICLKPRRIQRVRTLIVDNDEVSRGTIKSVLQGLSDCDEALDREAALRLFQEAHAAGQPFDLVTLAIAIPEMQEESIIKAFRGIEDRLQVPIVQRVCIPVITDLSAKQLKTDCIMHGCDDFIGKSKETERIVDKLAQLGLVAGSPPPEGEKTTVVTTAGILDAITRRVKRGNLQLPPAPKIAMRIRQLFTGNTEIAEVVDLFKQDPTISAKLINLSNSVVYGGMTKNTDVGHAVRRLGIDRTVEVVMSICCRGYFVTNHPAFHKLVDDLWWHSLACAHATEMVAHRLGWQGKEDLFALGLLHDTGKLVLLQVAADLQHPNKSEMDVDLKELQSMIAANHRRYGANVLKLWGYSKEFVSLIDHHHFRGKQPKVSAGQILHQSDLLAKAAGFELGTANPVDVSDALEQLGYDARLQEKLTARIAERMVQLRYKFG
jgi:HD-like signal output (HDOD) protein